ncbi:winged helix-turn-helix domain-containing protein [Acidithiobacillus sp. M4-SHS-6]|uniref:winged helix-turn-helix domain-containing protein n=1 Tax=Acidithiobacillus sp. M4-SHS-6 TaxID=3383024 RepID=UPI0039BDEDBD
MFYTLIGGVVHHALHLSDAMLLMTAVRAEAIHPVSGSRILVLAPGPSPDKLTLRLQRSGAYVKVLSAQAMDAASTIKGWHPALLIIKDWSPGMTPWLTELLTFPGCMRLSILAMGEDDEEHAMSALDAGASAYLVGTVAESIFLAQVGALLKNAQHWESTEIRQEPHIWINPGSSRVWLNGSEIRLSRRLFRFLHYLALHPDRTFTPLEIANVLSDGQKFIQENSIAAQVHRLRKIMDEAGAGEWLETVHGFGYRLKLPEKKLI